MTLARTGFLVLLVALVALTAGCAAAARVATPTRSPEVTPTPVPGAGGNIGGGGAGGNGSTGSGVVIVPPGGGIGDPNLGQATVVVPQRGQMDLRAVNVQLIRASVEGRHVTVELRWWSGIAPCSVLDSVAVARDGTTITLSPSEGSSARDVACVDLAQLKATVVDLGELEPGTWTIKASGDAEPVTVEVR
jgi:hypothetical protein